MWRKLKNKTLNTSNVSQKPHPHAPTINKNSHQIVLGEGRRVKVFFLNPTVRKEVLPEGTLNRYDIIISGDTIAEVCNEDGTLDTLVGPWETSLKEMYTTNSLNMEKEGLTIDMLYHMLESEDLGVDYVGAPDFLLAGEEISQVDLFFDKEGSIVCFRAEVDDTIVKVGNLNEFEQ